MILNPNIGLTSRDMHGKGGVPRLNPTKNLDKMKRVRNSPSNTMCVLLLFCKIATINIEII